jgi:hypothetical protein
VSTAITSLQSVLSKHGFKVFLVPDADNLLSKGGSQMSADLPFSQKVRFLIHNI